MGETISRAFTPPGTDVSGRGMAPQPVTRSDSSIEDAAKRRRQARAIATGIGQTRLASGLGDIGGGASGGSRRVGLVGEVG